MRPRLPVLAATLTLACGGNATDSAHQGASQSSTPPSQIAGTNPAPEESGDWIRPAKDFASTRFSSLNEITAANVKQLGVKVTFSTGVSKGHEAAPLVVNDTMYVVTPFPNVVYALDLAQPGAPLKWKYEPKPLAAAQGVACCDVVNRGAAYHDGLVVFNALDNRTIALDADTGAERWVAQLGDINNGETITMAPLIARDKVLVGNSGGEMGVRGWLTALHLRNGEIAWRAYTTGPDKDVLIGPRFKPFYQQDQGKDLGVSTWPPDGWKTGGGTVWGWISYDPALNLIYYGTANPTRVKRCGRINGRRTISGTTTASTSRS
jgi:lanthanide-dependent methanol dehydrogenase